jgi:3-phosphoshikimate 1-carboxyvinyltransferase
MTPICERRGTAVHIHPAGPLSGEVRLPGSKSLTQRYLVCAALADGRSTLLDVSPSEDARYMVAGLRELGFRVELDERRCLAAVTGAAGFVPADEAAIDAGSAGAVLRFLTAVCALGQGRYRLDGSAGLRRRPLSGLVGALRSLGVRVECAEIEGYAPLTVLGGGVSGGEVILDAPISSQFVSAVLMIAPHARADVLVAVDGGLLSRPYVEMTCHVMRAMGVELLSEVTPQAAARFVVPAPQRYRAGTVRVEPDASAASYFWAAAAMAGGRVRVHGLDRASVQGDVRFAGLLEQMGCTVRDGSGFIEVERPPGRELCGVSADLSDMPDVAPTLAVTALVARGSTEIRGAAHLRAKESDRIACVAHELRALGADVRELPDGLRIVPPAAITPATIETHDDHRIAMAVSLAGLVTEGVIIQDAGCVAKSLPGYFELLAELARGR